MQRVLIADDNSNIQKMVSLALKDAGIEVIAVNNGEAAVRKMPEVLPDLVLADIFMPVRSGYEVCEFVKRDPRFMHTPVILLAGAFDPFDEREAQRVQADGVLKKPFVPPDPLVNMVTALLMKAAGERLVPVGVSASHTARAEVLSHTAPVRDAVVEQFTDEPPEEFKLPSDSLAFADDKTLAFGSLLEVPPAPVEADSVVTAMRDPVLGDPAFWASTEVNEPPSPDELTEGHAWEEPVAASTEISHVQPADMDLPLEFPSMDYVAGELDEPAPEIHTSESNTSPVLEWPVGEEFVAEAVKAEEPTLAENSEAEPLPDFSALQTSEREITPSERETSSYIAEEAREVISVPEAEELAPAPRPEEPTPLEMEHPSLEVGELAGPKVEGPPAIESLSPSALLAPEIEPARDVSSHLPATDELSSVAGLAKTTEAELTSAPDFSSIFALAKTDLLPVIESEIKPYSVSPASAMQEAPAPGSPAASLPSESPDAAGPPSTEMIEAVVARVIERMQPKMIEIVTREILRPVVEALVRREIEKK